MKESVENLIQAIVQGNALETEKAFATAMAEKLAPMLDTRRQEVAQSMFAVQQEEETVSAETTTDISNNESSTETVE
jgi:hypothetical protein